MSLAFRRVLGIAIPAAFALSLTASAHATPILTGAVTVTETEACCLPLIDTVTVGPGYEIAGGDLTNIGGTILFSDEYIDITGNSIEFRIHGGGDAAGHTAGYKGTGYSADAQYAFTGLGFDVPGSILNVTFTLTNITDFGAADISFTGDSVTMRVANLGVLASATDLGIVKLNLATDDLRETAVPEPATVSLLTIGLIAGWRARRKSRIERSS